MEEEEKNLNELVTGAVGGTKGMQAQQQEDANVKPDELPRLAIKPAQT